ncbi:unnamed protein product [Pocillopora meandrina]|uniref:Beta-lactamase-related domain-containing protein n=1 Tax=Pocillopora meandrina TaxID=46732 RepID=A0AAU9WPM8_9CNID|nr:unnamed protein product [Pocillopora meandrina]
MLAIPRGQRIRRSSQYTLSFIATVTRIHPEMTSHSNTVQTLTFDFLESPRANGLISEQMQAFDGIILDFMKEQDIPGASVAISRGEELIYCQGYGCAGAGRKVQPELMFRIASISKTITAVGVMRLVEEGKLSLEDKVFGPKGILKEYNPTEIGDIRLLDITLKHLLHHSAGWDRDRAGDPVFWKVGKHMNVAEPVAPCVLIQYMMGRKLQFAPGRRHAYSNLGYTVLGQVIERVTDQGYEEFMATLLEAVEIKQMKIGRTRKNELSDEEVEYFHNRHPRMVRSIFPDGCKVPPQYGRWTMEEADAHGGWIATASELLKFLLSLEPGVNGKRIISHETFQKMLDKPSFEKDTEEWYGFGLDIRDNGSTWGHSGQMEGTSGVLTRHCEGYAWALLFNSWAKDLDLDGLVKYALSSTLCVSMQPSLSGVFPSSITTEDKRQLIKIMVPKHDFWPLYEDVKSRGFDLTWLNAYRFANALYFNMIFFQNVYLNSAISIYIGLTKDACRERLNKLVGLRPVHIETYVDNNDLLYALLLTSNDGNGVSWTLDLDLTVAQHRKNMPVMFKSGFNLTVQCLTEYKGRLHVSVLYEKVLNGECIAEFDLKPDYYQFEFHKQAKEGLMLSYAKAYNVKGQPRFSVIWTNEKAEISGTRHNVSKYGFLFELREAAKKNFYAKCVSCYNNEDVLNFLASWNK